MNANDYQKQAARTLIDDADIHLTQREQDVLEQAIATYIAAGNVVDALKKQILHRHGVDHWGLQALVNDVGLQVRRTRAHLEDLKTWPQGHLHSRLTPRQRALLWTVAGLAGESAEVAGLVMAGAPGLTEEIGDMQWYTAMLCTKADIAFGDTLTANIAKLRRRYPDGWSEADSLARKDVEEDYSGAEFEV